MLCLYHSRALNGHNSKMMMRPGFSALHSTINTTSSCCSNYYYNNNSSQMTCMYWLLSIGRVPKTVAHYHILRVYHHLSTIGIVLLSCGSANLSHPVYRHTYSEYTHGGVKASGVCRRCKEGCGQYGVVWPSHHNFGLGGGGGGGAKNVATIQGAVQTYCEPVRWRMYVAVMQQS